MAGGYLKAADLPQVIPVFPLDGVLLLPHGMLPLNIFEPRYLNMIDDAMSGDRIIGMVQSQGPADDRGEPVLAQVGCAGRITSYAETSDGRYLMALQEETTADRPGLLAALRAYLERRGMEVDWRMAKEAPLEALVNSLAMALPFDCAEKQALLEACDLEARRSALTALLRIDAAVDDDNPSPLQ
jgi:Lon protease-like protein